MEEIEVDAGCQGDGHDSATSGAAPRSSALRRPDGTFDPQPPTETVLARGRRARGAWARSGRWSGSRRCSSPTATRRAGGDEPARRPARRGRGCGGPGAAAARAEGAAHARAPAQGRVRRLLDQRRHAARAGAGRAAARRSPSGWATSCARGWTAGWSGSRSPGPGSSTCSCPTGGSARRCATCSRPATPTAAARRDAVRAGAGRVRLRQPHRSRSRRPRAATRPTATRWRGCSSWSATPSSASTTSTTTAARCRSWASRSRPGRAGRRCPRMATRAPTWPSWPSASPTRPRPTSTPSRAPASSSCSRASAPRCTVSASTSTPGSRRHRCTRARPRRCSAASPSSSSAACTYRSEGALWLRSSQFGDEKDRVLERASGAHTYLASDVAYHQDKRAREFDRMIDVWGADHHGYVAAHAGPLPGPRRRARAARARDHAVRPRRRARRALVDVQAPGRVRDPRRPHGPDRGRRDALLPAAALARHHGRPRPRPRPRAVGREPRLLRPVRARAHRVDAAQGGGGAGGRGAGRRRWRRRCTRPSAA